jgi:hypothetical protein
MDSVKIIFLLYYFLFFQYLHADQTRCHVCMGIDIAPRPSHLGSTIASMTRHRHRAVAKLPRQRRCHSDLASTLHRGQIISAAPSPARLEGLARTSPTSNLTRKFTTDQTQGLLECFSDGWPDSDTLLPTTPALTQGKHVVTTMIWDTSLNQLSHFLSCIFPS